MEKVGDFIWYMFVLGNVESVFISMMIVCFQSYGEWFIRLLWKLFILDLDVVGFDYFVGGLINGL